jgi:hypothetical protein
MKVFRSNADMRVKLKAVHDIFDVLNQEFRNNSDATKALASRLVESQGSVNSYELELEDIQRGLRFATSVNEETLQAQTVTNVLVAQLYQQCDFLKEMKAEICYTLVAGILFDLCRTNSNISSRQSFRPTLRC